MELLREMEHGTECVFHVSFYGHSLFNYSIYLTIPSNTNTKDYNVSCILHSSYTDRMPWERLTGQVH